jgi:hypothetical protein
MNYYTLYKTCFYDTLGETYDYIITINSIPLGNLNNFVTTIKIPYIGKSQKYNYNCTYAITNNFLNYHNNNNNNNNICTIDNLPELITWLLSNQYIIEDKITSKINNITSNNSTPLFIISYNN